MFFALLLVVVCVVGFGFYSGWWSLSSSSPDAASGKVDINLTVDPDKMKADAETVKKKTAEFTGQDKEDSQELGDHARDKVTSDRE